MDRERGEGSIAEKREEEKRGGECRRGRREKRGWEGSIGEKGEEERSGEGDGKKKKGGHRNNSFFQIS